MLLKVVKLYIVVDYAVSIKATKLKFYYILCHNVTVFDAGNGVTS